MAAKRAKAQDKKRKKGGKRKRKEDSDHSDTESDSDEEDHEDDSNDDDPDEGGAGPNPTVPDADEDDEPKDKTVTQDKADSSDDSVQFILHARHDPTVIVLPTEQCEGLEIPMNSPPAPQTEKGSDNVRSQSDNEQSSPSDESVFSALLKSCSKTSELNVTMHSSTGADATEDITWTDPETGNVMHGKIVQVKDADGNSPPEEGQWDHFSSDSPQFSSDPPSDTSSIIQQKQQV